MYKSIETNYNVINVLGLKNVMLRVMTNLIYKIKLKKNIFI